MATTLTARQNQILQLIQQSVRQTGFPPTRAEIAQQLGFKSTNAAEDHLRALARKGYIEMKPGISRGIRLTQQNGALSETAGKPDNKPETPTDTSMGSRTNTLLVPLIGRVAAGSPILAQENVEREIAVEPSLFSSRPDYLLKVRGASMKDIGIMDGDLLAVKRTPEARNGAIVVARIDDEVTVKRLSMKGRKITLLPENPEFKPIEVQDGQQFAIEGLAVGLIRTHGLH